MTKIIERGSSEVVETYHLTFRYKTGKYEWEPYHLFECDKDGNVEEPVLDSQTYKDCIEMEQRGELCTSIDRSPKVVRHPTIIECCGEQLECWNFTNTCDICGADYNWAGLRLAPRSQWGEETGEHYTDIVNMREPYDDNY